MKSLISKKRLTEEEERRTKPSLDSPQMIEVNKNTPRALFPGPIPYTM